MDPLVLDDEWSLSALEDALHRIASSQGAPLQLSKDFPARRKGALHDAARLQLLTTWARNSADRRLYFHAANLPSTVLKELCDYAPGIAALRMSNAVVVGDSSIPRRQALEPAAKKMASTDEMQWGRIVKGRTIDFSCVSGSQVQYLRPLFTVRNSRAVKRKDGMYQVLKVLSDYISQYDAERIPDAFLRACAIFTSELFRNTQEHATRDPAGRPYLEHVEGIIVSWQEMTESFAGDFSGHVRLTDFWNREQSPVQGGATTVLRCLQISFFDTGPGFASRATGKDTSRLDPAEERDALLACLEKNASTKNESGAGNGLPDVLRALRDVGGLVAIRSGRLNLFNTFAREEQRDLFAFEDWSERKLAPAVGAVVSLLLPIRR